MYRDESLDIPVCFVAALQNSLSCLRVLALFNVNFNLGCDNDAARPVHAACLCNNLEALQVLHVIGAILNPLSTHDYSPLQYCEKHNSSDCLFYMNKHNRYS